MKFEVGDRVSWSSQAAGIWKSKTGVVVAVVAPNQLAEDALRGQVTGRARIDGVAIHVAKRATW